MVAESAGDRQQLRVERRRKARKGLEAAIEWAMEGLYARMGGPWLEWDLQRDLMLVWGNG